MFTTIIILYFTEYYNVYRYDFEIKNDFGSVHGTVTLIVQVDRSEREGGEIGGVATERLESNAIARERFGEYVKQLHQLNDKGFESHYKVYIWCSYIERAGSSRML